MVEKQPEEEEQGEEQEEEPEDVDTGMKSNQNFWNKNQTPQARRGKRLRDEAEASSHLSRVLLAEAEPPSCQEMTPAQRERLRNQKLNERKLTIAGLASAIVSDPIGSVRPGAALGSGSWRVCVCLT